MKVPVVFATDENYLFYTVVAITSMAENASEDTFYQIYILVSGALEKGHRILTDLEEKYANLKINLLPVDGREFQGVTINNKHITKATFYRLLLSELLQEEKCLYLDSDIVVNTDLQELYCTDIGENYIAGVRDLWIDLLKESERETRRIRTNIPTMDQYVNAGVLLFNLDKIRADHMEERFREHMNNNYLFEDQDIINVCCYDNIRRLPAKWNLFTSHMGLLEELKDKGVAKETIQYMEEKKGILHYATILIRPWESKRFICNDIWWKYAEVWRNTPEFQRMEKRMQQHELGYSEEKTAAYCAAYDKVYIWGFTVFGRSILTELMKRGTGNIAAFIDNDIEKQKFTYCGRPVVSFDTLSYEQEKCALIIASQKSGNEIKNMLIAQEVREEDIICFVQKSSYYYKCLRPEFCEGEE